LGFQSVRFHGLLDDDMSVCTRGENGLVFSFFNIDSIFDYLLQIGMSPFIELSFMPRALASGTATIFHYQGNVTPPADYAEWELLVETLTRHLVARYGVTEVRRWCFEVWNEPNLQGAFWAGTQADYFKLYRHSAAAIKRVDTHIPVGGPATAINAWIPELVQYCRSEGVALDFISTHHYPTDAALDLYGKADMGEMMAKAGRGVLKGMAARARSEAGALPLYYTEWNNSPSSRDPYHDDPFAAAFAVKTIVDMEGLVDLYSFWTFSDIFEEASFPSSPFHGGFGLLTLHGVPKPTYRAFQMLHRLGTQRWEVVNENHPTVDALAVSRGLDVGGRFNILITNHQVPAAPVMEEQVNLRVRGLQAKHWSVLLERIDEQHANAKKTWQAMGAPEYLDAAQVDALQAASSVTPEALVYRSLHGELEINFLLPPHAVVLVTLTTSADVLPD
jgi:xylan 1,4-beta-xylosidase